MAVAVLVATPTIPTMDYQFGPPPLRDTPGDFDGFALRVSNCGCARASLCPHRPLSVARHDVLVPFGHGRLTIGEQVVILSELAGGRQVLLYGPF